MIVILGLIIFVAAVVVGVAGVFGNGGSAHALTHGFSVFGYHVTGSTGTLFLCGIAVGALALFGLWLLLAGARRTSRRGSAARREVRQSRRETAQSRQETAAVAKDRDELIGQRDTARAYTASTLGNGTHGSERPPSPDQGRPNPDEGRRSRPRLFGRRPAPRQAAATPPESPAGQSAPDVPAGAPAPDVPAGAPAPAE
jgi:hypothetical protein